MALLLYKSKEMFSTTELIRKSKMIFDKIVDEEIEKAIIMRDGKPGFLLMDFEKYESIMEEYENLKVEYEKLTKQKSKKKKEQKDIKIPTQDLKKPEEKIVNEKKEIVKEPPVKKEVVEKPSVKQDDQESPDDRKKRLLSQLKPVTQETVEDIKEIKKEKKSDEPMDEAAEIKEALAKIKNLNFSEEERLKVESQIKDRIRKAREERAKVLEKEDEHDSEDLKEELELQVQLKEVKKKKDQELSEFWN